MMGWYYGDVGWGGWVLMALMMLAFWGLLVFGGIAVFRSLRRDEGSSAQGRSGAQGRSDAQRLLDERFARGEIDADEYRARRELLHSGH